MQRKRLTRVLVLLNFAALVALHLESGGAANRPSTERGAKEVFTGTIVGIGGALGGVSRPFTMEINGVTSDADAERFAQILRTKGQDALLKAVAKEKKGRFAVDGHLGHDLNSVCIRETPNGRRITALFDRWERMYELRYGTRSLDYPFTYIELFVDDSGKGDGSLIAAAKVYFDKKDQNSPSIENFGIYPARLMGVQLRTK
jgi:hypothetical protein